MNIVLNIALMSGGVAGCLVAAAAWSRDSLWTHNRRYSAGVNHFANFCVAVALACFTFAQGWAIAYALGQIVRGVLQ